MKKVFLASGIIAALGLVAFAVSCKKKDTECTCVVNGDSGVRKPSDAGVSTCAEMQKKAQEVDPNATCR